MRGDLEAKYCLQKQEFTKYLRPTLVFMRNSTLRENFNIFFFEIFLLVLGKCLFWQEELALGYHSMKL